jgi:hypothetical protein
MGFVSLAGPEIKMHLSDGLGDIPLISQGAGKGWHIFRQIDAKGANTGVWILPGHNAAPIGHAGGIAHVGIGKPDPFAGQFVDIGGLQYPVARTSQVIGALLIRDKKYNVHISSLYWFARITIFSNPPEKSVTLKNLYFSALIGIDTPRWIFQVPPFVYILAVCFPAVTEEVVQFNQ